MQETRQSLARHYLEKTALSAAEIALLVEFSEPNPFHRAVRDGTGRCPERLRLQARPSPPPGP